MSTSNDRLLDRIRRLERIVERLSVGERGVTSPSDHGMLNGLSDNDHPQYLLTTGKAADSDKLDGVDSSGFATASHDHDADYLGISAKAADSDKLDGNDSTAFATAGHDHVGLLKFLSTPITAYSSQQFVVGSPVTYNAVTLGVPSNATAVLLRTYSDWAAISSGTYLSFRKYGSSNHDMIIRAITTDGLDNIFFVQLDASGRFTVQAYGADTVAYCGGIINGYIT